jgi:hypothetical protein
LPGLRPDLVREERFFAGSFFDHRSSEDGGRDKFDESAADRRLNSAISSACSATIRSSSTTRAVSLAFSATICSSSTTRAVNCPTSCRSCS